mgnify:CR=1 FL=1
MGSCYTKLNITDKFFIDLKIKIIEIKTEIKNNRSPVRSPDIANSNKLCKITETSPLNSCDMSNLIIPKINKANSMNCIYSNLNKNKSLNIEMLSSFLPIHQPATAFSNRRQYSP